MFLNEIKLTGKVLKDAERTGLGPWKFTLTQGGGRKKDGKSCWPLEYFPCLCWHDVSATVKAGAWVAVVGRLKHESWQDEKTGAKRHGYKIQCESVADGNSKPEAVSANVHGVDITDDDIPF